MSAYDRAQAAIEDLIEKQIAREAGPRWWRDIQNSDRADRLVQFIRGMKRPGEAD